MALTYERASELLRYDPNTGLISWAVSRPGRGRIFAGKAAGYVSKRDGYVCLMVDHKMYRAHRIAFLLQTGSHPVLDIDHINGDRSDNRWENLRQVSKSKNQQNRHCKTTKRKYADLPFGVETCDAWLENRKKPYAVRLWLNGRKRLIGYFRSVEEAAIAAIESRKRFYEGFV